MPAASPSALHARLLLPQLSALTALRRLELSYTESDSPADYDALSDLTALHSLRLMRCGHLPACLPQLPALRALRLEDTPPQAVVGRAAAAAQLRAAVQPLTRLTHLVLETVPAFPPEVAGLWQLQVGRG